MRNGGVGDRCYHQATLRLALHYWECCRVRTSLERNMGSWEHCSTVEEDPGGWGRKQSFHCLTFESDELEAVEDVAVPHTNCRRVPNI